MKTNPLQKLNELGQSVWLDNLTRPLVKGGGLARLIKQDGITGLTSNPAIFNNAMTKGDAYDASIRALAEQGRSAGEIYEALAIEDIRGAADLLRPVYDRTGGLDGFVSLEVSPHLARDTQGTIKEASRLWKIVDRPNLFIKIPGTEEGLPAIESCLAQGVNVNITLLFALDAHRKVIEAYFRAMERRIRENLQVKTIASVASFFLSRIDVKVDAALDRMIAAGDRAAEAKALRGHTAIANARLAYRMWKEMHAAPRWKKLQGAGVQVQRPLWASTSTKDPTESDVKYVEALIGPQTVNTMPDETIEAFRDHGRVEPTVERDVDGARRQIERLKALGIDIDRVTGELLAEGIDKFNKPFDALLQALDRKRAALAASGA
jgi:transaldolase / glucose-6-phosphate isomerase